MRPGLLRRLLLLAVAAGMAASLAACGGSDDEAAAPAPAAPAPSEPAPAEPAPAEPAPAEPTPAEPAPAEPAAPAPAPADLAGLSGEIQVDGSSTVGPLVQIAAEDFGKEAKDVKITVGISGTGGGFERFCKGETDISNASRAIKDEEAAVCKEAGIDFVEFQVATDALTIVTNTENDWATCLTVDQLKTMWGPEAEGTVDNWNKVDPSFPDQSLTLYGPGTDSGTFDYFTKEINGEEGASRADYNASEDDNVTVQGVEGDKGALGYFGLSYYEQNQDKLTAVQVDSGNGCVTPSAETALDGTYTPLSRPLFVYVKKESFQRPEVDAFVKYMLDNNETVAGEALFIPLTADQKAQEEADYAAALGA